MQYVLFIHSFKQVIRPEHSEKWTLQIKFPQIRDAGIYECQVNTEPKMSMAFRLNIVGMYYNVFFIMLIISRTVAT